LDVTRGLVFVPTGSAAFDFYGADRHGDNLFANSLLALDASSGRRVWHFQFVRHDVWDRDLPATPTLITLQQEGKRIDAVAQITKSGHVFVFDRQTGTPLFPLVSRSVPASGVTGEKLASEQVLPSKPPPFARQIFTEDMATKRTPDTHRAVVKRLRDVRTGGQFTPPSLDGTIIFPGFDGGGEWGGAAFDPDSSLLYVNSNEMPWILRLVERIPESRRTSGKQLYHNNCASCHKADMTGTPPEFPSLVGIAAKRAGSDLSTVIRKGAGRMPPFAHLGDESVNAIVSLLVSGENKEVVSAPDTPDRAPALKYHHDGYNRFLDPDGYPAVEPPWGTLNAIDLQKGEIRWSLPLGEYPEFAKQGLRDTGTENYGGPIVTAGGLIFIGATNFDKKFRAFDKATGKLLWSADLPAGGNATPATYEVDGRQFIVIAAGGGKSGQPSGGDYVAFALPEVPERKARERNTKANPSGGRSAQPPSGSKPRAY
ncbi:MAG TPA: c-type cytochrome, partial [Bryobacteraceae bacterium]|nr:c-type cytochrome [Bryobacteraceae bacterium]